MASSSNKKLIILYILKILQDYSDENHPLKQSDIAKKLNSLYGVECERKSIGANIDYLIDFGYDIKKLPQGGCFLVDRVLENSEISYLIDSLFSSRTINGEYAKTLANKLSNMLSVYDRKKFNYIYKADEISRSSNKQIFYTIDVINKAIDENKKVEFNYYRYYVDKQKFEKQKNKLHIANPYFMINSQGKYYLVANDEHFDNLTNYRIENIENIKIIDKVIKPITTIKDCENGIDKSKYANENVYMLDNKTISATIKISNEYAANYVVDWFGKNSRLYTKNETIYADVETNEQSLIYWCLQYGNSVELVSPQETRDKIKATISQMEKNYK